MDPSAVPYRAGWYPDPLRRFEFRYHNGSAWTGDVSVDGARFFDPVHQPSRSNGETGSPVPASHPDSAAPAPAGKATAALVLGIASVAVGWVPFVFVLAVAAAVLALVFSTSVLRRSRRDRTADARPRRFAVAAAILAPIGLGVCFLGAWLSVVVYREVEEFTETGPYSIVQESCDVGGGVATVTGSVTNQSDSTRSYRIVIAFIRPGTDNELHVATADAVDVRSGATETWSANVLVNEEDLECEIDEVTGPPPFGQS